MINLMIKNILENTERIDAMTKYVNKINSRQCLNVLLLTASIFAVTKVIEKHERRINDLETKLEELKSKGE